MKQQTEQAGFWTSITHLLGTRSVSLLLTAACFKASVGYGVAHWLPSYYIREYGLTKAEVGATLGPLIGITGLIAIPLASIVADRLSQRDVRWYAWIMAGAMFLSAPFHWIAFLTNQYLLSLVFIGLAAMCGSSILAIINSMVQSASPVQMRGVSAGMKTFALSFIGYGLGGYMIGLLSDAMGLRTALLTVVTGHLIAAILFLISASSLGRDIDRARVKSGAADAAGA